ncbi:3-carboxy-cis,cis-muconate cycloisomerase [Actinospica durhamensis]|uniref:3-carboxy-cis,cis-muconate cycloisomerase n=1 Tax=Actinospica durhamensis TaxID=1508375 RepID=A0A941IRY0_9ACTN|nr:3-carboxy-cis,cis-muconate cycloisomerase [Actinospica durhamensis]MBR7832706.1 3-carboxy-cis,cis-muconate cycloisomerase [Actinospica durhamensis]
MTSAEPAGPLEVGLLAPGRPGGRVEAETGDGAYLKALLDAEAALTRAQAGLGLVPPAAAAAVDAAARAPRFDARALALASGGGNPVIPLVGELRRAVGAEHAGSVHRGATSQDIMDTATMLVATRVRTLILAELDRVAAALAELAAAHRATPMAGRTLTQQAVPTTFGLKAAGWRSLVLDARDRLSALNLPAQLGGAAGTLAAFTASAGGPDTVFALVDRFAAETGLDAPALPWHVLRTPIAELGAALALTAGALGKFAADVLVLGRTELAEVRQTDGAGGSSAMPHKANPVDAALIAAAARQLPALASVLYGSMVAEDERPAGAWHAEWLPLREALRLTGTAAALAAHLAETLRPRPERMSANLELTRGLIVSERLVEVLEELLGAQAARSVLTAAARAAEQGGTTLAEALGQLPEISGLIDAGTLTPERLGELTDPAAYLGVAAELTDRALTRAAAGAVQKDEGDV